MNKEEYNLSAMELIEQVTLIPRLQEEIINLSKKFDESLREIAELKCINSNLNYTQRQAAIYLNISTPFLIKCREQQLIKFEKIGNRVIYKKKDLDKFKLEALPYMPHTRK